MTTQNLERELTNERGQMLARRYLRDLRSDAVIDYRCARRTDAARSL